MLVIWGEENLFVPGLPRRGSLCFGEQQQDNFVIELLHIVTDTCQRTGAIGRNYSGRFCRVRQEWMTIEGTAEVFEDREAMFAEG